MDSCDECANVEMATPETARDRHAGAGIRNGVDSY